MLQKVTLKCNPVLKIPDFSGGLRTTNHVLRTSISANEIRCEMTADDSRFFARIWGKNGLYVLEIRCSIQLSYERRPTICGVA